MLKHVIEDILKDGVEHKFTCKYWWEGKIDVEMITEDNTQRRNDNGKCKLT